jgi:purine-binding chemotaxis protein CheW
MTASRQMCTFYVNQQCYGIDVLQVREIVRSQPLTRVPLADPMVRGLMNLRGQIVTAIDMRRRLGARRAIGAGQRRPADGRRRRGPARRRDR